MGRIKKYIEHYLINSVAYSGNQFIQNTIFRMIKFCNNSVNIRRHCYFQTPSMMSFGKNIFINKNSRFYNGYGQRDAQIIIHDNVTIGFENVFVTTSHNLGNGDQRADFRDYYCAPIEIEEGVWITTNCTILPGVHIGKGCVIAAGAVVTKDCEANNLYGGVPAVKLKRLS